VSALKRILGSRPYDPDNREDPRRVLVRPAMDIDGNVHPVETVYTPLSTGHDNVHGVDLATIRIAGKAEPTRFAISAGKATRLIGVRWDVRS
jgi:hypothetical protein